MTEFESIAPGAMVGPFRIERRLGGGGMGVVYEATEVSLGRRVALKLISPQLAFDQAFRERFIQEARVQAALDSAHVVKVYSHGEAEGMLYIASQLVPEGDLGALVYQYGVPPLATALDLIAQVADGLSDAHEAGLIHRDIKPANVLIRRRGTELYAFLADFGIARHSDAEVTRVGSQAVGTPSYMAPELHTGSVAQVRTDIYSLGCLLWATLSGHSPYGGSTDFEVILAHQQQQIPQLSGTGPRVEGTNQVLLTAMAKRPEDRYVSAAQMRDELRRVARLHGEVTDAMAGGPVMESGPVPVADPPPPPSGSGPEPGLPSPQQPPSPAPYSPAPYAPPPVPYTPPPYQPPPPYDPNAQPVGTGGFQQHPFTPGPVSGTGRAKRSPVVMLAVAGVALIAVIGIAVLAMQAFNKDGGGGGGGGGDKPTPPTPTVALAQADLEDKMTSWVSGLGFVSPTVTCQGDLGRDEGSVQFCDIDADGTPSWGRAEVTGYDGDEPTVEMLPYLPGDTVAQAIEDSNTSGETISVDCTDYLLGVVGEEIDCPVTGSSAGSTVQISVTKIEELRINFNWQVV